jgi:pyruvate/2-oxoglutarate dehydrogenase complex dihydrolipoamide acyltransferase (E2) component
MAHDVILPKLGLTMEDGIIVSWAKNVGDTVEKDEPIAVIETEKIDADLLAPASGTLTEILFPEGTTVLVGTVIARIDS